MLSRPVSILIIEDEEAHAEAVRRAFEPLADTVELTVASTIQEAREHIGRCTPGLVIADWLLPDGNATDILRTEEGRRIPFILMTSSGNEQVAVDAMKLGVLDYVVKSASSFADMPHVADRALRQWNLMLERRRAEEALRDREERYRSLFENMLDGFAHCRMIFADGEPRDFVYLKVNDSFGRLTGLKNVIGRKVTEIIPGIRESNPELFEIYGKVALTGNPEKFETYVDSLGIWFSISAYSTKSEYFITVFDDITERKRTEKKALRESEERFRTLANGGFESVVISRDGIILDSNKVFCDMSGYTMQDLVGMKIQDITAPEFKDSAMKHVLSGSEHAYESALVCRDGRVIPVLVKGKTVPYEGGPARIASVHDITAVRKAEQVQKRLATAIEQAAEGVLITNAEGIIEYVNPAVEKITGFSGEELVGRTPRVLRSGEHDSAFYRDLWATIKAGNIWTGNLINRKKDGRLYHEASTISPVKDASGKVINFVAVKRDITEHLDLSKQLLQAQKMEAIGTLAGGVAHDFNNILQVALGYCELILGDEELPGHYRADLRKIYEAGRRGADLVQRLLTFSRKTEMKPQPLNLNRRVTELGKMLERTIPRMIDIQLILGENLATINADPPQIDQVLMNLAVNARDAMPEGGKLIVETANIIIDAEYIRAHLDAKPGHHILLMVTDTGSGMDKDTLEHIFEPFFTTKAVSEGTGLGLAIVHGIVRQHGGHIRCYSELGQGTTFKIYLPALVSNEDIEETKVGPMPRGGSETILLVDDEEMIRDLCSRILTESGYNVITASNGKEALVLYRVQKEKISLVILDLIMPEMGGKQCLESLLTLDPAVKVVIASGYSGKDTAEEALTAGAKGFVNKPYDMRQVLGIVRAVLDDKMEPEERLD